MYRIFRFRKGAVLISDVSFTIVIARDRTEAKNMYDAAVGGPTDDSLYTTVVEAVTEAQ